MEVDLKVFDVRGKSVRRDMSQEPDQIRCNRDRNVTSQASRSRHPGQGPATRDGAHTVISCLKKCLSHGDSLNSVCKEIPDQHAVAATTNDSRTKTQCRASRMAVGSNRWTSR